MKKAILKVIILVFFISQQVSAQINSDSLHFNALVADLHSDALDSYFRTGRSIEHFSNRGDVDFDRLKMGGVDVQFFAVWPDPYKAAIKSHYLQAVDILDTLDNILERNRSKIELALSPSDINKIVKSKKIAACIGLEGGNAIDNDLGKLEYFYKRGVRYLGLTWNDSPKWASSAKDESHIYGNGQKGLTEFGKKVIKKMNALGMMIDVSHSGEKTFYDVLAASSKPIIASHSSVYSICHHYRNLKDEQIKALARNGGVMFINFSPNFLVKDFSSVYSQARKDADAIQDSLIKIGKLETFNRSAFIYKQINPLYPDVKTVVDHIEYVINLVGDDYVGLGSDFDGIPLTPHGLQNVSKMPSITKELVKRGHSESSIRKILGGNFMRVFRSNIN